VKLVIKEMLNPDELLSMGLTIIGGLYSIVAEEFYKTYGIWITIPGEWDGY